MEIKFIQDKFGEAIVQAKVEFGQAILEVKPATLHELLQFCRDDSRLKMHMLLDVVAVDFPRQPSRFEVVYLLYSVELKVRMRIKVRVAEGEALPTATDLWRSADWAEREVWDMFGIRFTGHPNLKRILMFEGFEGHPLRKDYPINRRQQIPEIEEIP